VKNDLTGGSCLLERLALGLADDYSDAQPACLSGPIRCDLNMSETQQTSVLTELRRELARILGDRFEAAYLFGSRARGEQRPDSDVDVLVVVRGPFDYGDLIRCTSALVSALSLKHDAVISRAFVSQERFEREQSPFLMNVRREAVAV
jgi:predicted nucleotidyltransferase